MLEEGGKYTPPIIIEISCLINIYIRSMEELFTDKRKDLNFLLTAINTPLLQENELVRGDQSQ